MAAHVTPKRPRDTNGTILVTNRTEALTLSGANAPASGVCKLGTVPNLHTQFT